MSELLIANIFPKVASEPLPPYDENVRVQRGREKLVIFQDRVPRRYILEELETMDGQLRERSLSLSQRTSDDEWHKIMEVTQKDNDIFVRADAIDPRGNPGIQVIYHASEGGQLQTTGRPRPHVQRDFSGEDFALRLEDFPSQIDVGLTIFDFIAHFRRGSFTTPHPQFVLPG